MDMRIRGIIRALTILLCAGGLIGAAPVSAGIRIVEDEVIFTLHAPGARGVFLVGDFNNWNPTVEKMEREGDDFHVSLFLVEGEYRYKFVVDGVWISDPDYPPKDPQLGSLLSLEERAGVLVLRDLYAETLVSGPAMKPSARYIAAFRLDDGDLNSNHLIDLGIGVEDKAFASRVIFKTRDESWGLSPLKSEIRFDRGRLDSQIRKIRIVAFENDTVWTSSDPFQLVGSIGVYNYNFGYGRKGASLEFPISEHFAFRAVYADRNAEEASVVQDLPQGALASFENASSADTVLYAYDNGFGDADAFGIEVLLQTRDLEIGYVRKNNRGFHPGLLAQIERRDTLFDTAVFETREHSTASVIWAGAKLSGSARIRIGFGLGDAWIHRVSRSVSVAGTLDDVRLGQAAEGCDAKTRFQTSRRWKGHLDYTKDRLRGAIRVERSTFEFGSAVFPNAKARIFRSELEAVYSGELWSTEARFEYTDQDYGGTPPDFHFDTPARNFWLDYGDRLWPEVLTGLDRRAFSCYRLAFKWNPRAPFSREAAGPGRPFSLLGELGATTKGAAEAVEHGYARISIEHFMRKHIYLQVDSRGAFYDKTPWGGRRGFLSLYLEAGYRKRWIELSIGLGVDPVILDPVANEYAGIGRAEHLRQAATGVLLRDRTAEVGKHLLELERSLERERLAKLEWVLIF